MKIFYRNHIRLIKRAILQIEEEVFNETLKIKNKEMNIKWISGRNL